MKREVRYCPTADGGEFVVKAFEKPVARGEAGCASMK
jgi:hypothetical protein